MRFNYEPKVDPLTREDVDRLINACKTVVEKLVVWIPLETGLRVSELCSLKPENCEWSTNRIWVIGKRKKKRFVPMSDRIARLLRRYFEDNEKINFGVSWCQKVLKMVARRAMVRDGRVHPHMLRHTFAVRSLQDSGCSLPGLQKVLGHSHLSTTAIYLNVSNEEACREFLEKRK